MAWVDLHSAAARGDLDQLRRHWWMKKFLINKRNADKQTPLHLACINGHADVVRFLLGKNCKLDPRDKYKKSPLIMAIQHQHRDCAAILLEHGANLDHRAAAGNTALHFAVLVSSKSLVELLLEHGADINVKNELGFTPLALAITERCKGMVEFLLQKGADVNATDNHERTPMEVAAVLQHKDAVKVLLRHGGVMNTGFTGAYSARAFEELFQNEFIANEGGEYECSERKGQCSARGTEGINSSCSGTTADILLNTPALPESCKTLCYQKGVLPAVREEPKKDQDSPWDSEVPSLEEIDSKAQGKVLADLMRPAAVGKSLDKRSVAVEQRKGTFRGKSARKGVMRFLSSLLGVMPAVREESKKDKDSPWDSETDTKGQGKVSTDLMLPAAVSKTLDVAVEHSKGVLPAAGEDQKEDNDSPWDSETDSKGQEKVSADLMCPAAVGKTLDERSVAVEQGKGALPAAGEDEMEDNDSPWDSETDSEGPCDVWKNVSLFAAFGNKLDARSMLVGSSKGVLPAAGEDQKEDKDSPWDSKIDSKGQGKVSADLMRPAAVGKTLDERSVAVEQGKGALPAAGEDQKEDNDSPWDSETDSEGPPEKVLLPAAVGKSLDKHSTAVKQGKGAAGKKKKEDDDFPWDDDDDFSWLLEIDSKGQGKVSADLMRPAAVGKSLDKRSTAVKQGKGVLPGAAGKKKKEDDDFSWDDDDFSRLLEIDSKGQGKVSADLMRPAAAGKSLDKRSVAVKQGKGVLPGAAGKKKKEDDDFSWDDDDISRLLEIDSEGPPEKVLLPAAVGKSLDKRSTAVKQGKGAAGKKKKEDDDFSWEDDDFSWLLEIDSKGQGKVLADLMRPAAAGKSLDKRSVAVEQGKGVLPGAAGKKKKEDDDFSWDDDDISRLLEIDSKGQGKVSADLMRPAAVGKSLDERSVAVEQGKGVLPGAAGKKKKEDDDFSLDDDDISRLLEIDSKGQGKVSADLMRPAAVGKTLDERSVAVEQGKGALPGAGEDQKEDNDSPWDSETDSEGPPENVLLSAGVGMSLDERSTAVEQGKAPGAEKKEYFVPSSKKKLPTLEGADLQLRSDFSSQRDSQVDRQLLVTQLLKKPDEVLKKNSLAETSLGAMKTHSKDVKEQKLLVQEKLERSETKELKESHVQKGCFPESLKDAPKEKEKTISRNPQGLSPSCNVSLPAAVRELRERLECLDVEYARLEATVQTLSLTVRIIDKFRTDKKTCNYCTIHGGVRPKLP